MFHSILNKINNGVAFEASKTTEAKVTWKKKKIKSEVAMALSRPGSPKM